MVLVGPYNDSGWSQATYEGGQYAVSKIPNAKLIYVDNGFSHQGVTPAQLGEQLLAQGANLIIFNSDDFKDDSNTFAKAHPTVPTIMLSGDQSWVQGSGLPEHSQYGQHHAAHRIRQDDRRLRGCHDHPDRSDWLPGSIDQS